MDALIYHRVSAADHGESVDRGLDRLRRHAEGRGWEVLEEASDVGPRHDTVRPGYRRIRELLAPAEGEVADAPRPSALLVVSLSRLFPSSRAALLDLDTWLRAGIALVALDDLVDTTRTSDAIAFRTVLEVLARFERDRHREATVIGLLRAELARHGRPLGPGRPTIAVDLVQLQHHWARGLSYRAIHRELNRQPHGPSYGTVVNRLRLLASQGRLDDAARRQAQGRNRDRLSKP